MSDKKSIVEEDLIGKIAICGNDIIGIITGRKTLDHGESWIGERLDDGGPWASRNPEIIADSIEEYNNQLLDDFGFDEEDDEEEEEED